MLPVVCQQRGGSRATHGSLAHMWVSPQSLCMWDVREETPRGWDLQVMAREEGPLLEAAVIGGVEGLSSMS